MTVSNVHRGHPLDPAQRRPSGSQLTGLPWRVGQRVDVRVLEKADAARYWVSLGGARQVVESMVALRPGDTIRTEVAAIGAQTELRYLGLALLGQSPDAGPTEEPTDQAVDLLRRLARTHRIALSEEQYRQLADATDNAGDPEATALGGLYLLQLGLPLDTASLDALVLVQAAAPRPADSAAAGSLAVLADKVLHGDEEALSASAKVLAEVLDVPDAPADRRAGATQTRPDAAGAPQLSGDPIDPDGSRQSETREFARWLLNQHDGGAAGYRYGSVPVLVGGELVELDVVYFHHRRPGAEHAPLRRLVMTLQTASFGQVEVLAEAVDRRLLIRFASERPDAGQLASRADEVRELVTRLGWSVDSVAYDIDRRPLRAARHVIDHVLEGDRFERVL